MQFKAQIKDGAVIGIDMGWTRWPKSHWNVGRKVSNPRMEFDAELSGDLINLTAPGFGAKGNYGNGGISVRGVTDLVMADEDRKKIVASFRYRKQKEVDEAVARLAGLKTELDAIT